MNKLVANLSLAALSTLSLLAFSPNVEAADLKLDKDLLDRFFADYFQNEGKAFDERALPQLDASNLYWDGGADSVEVFFIDEGAGFQNQLLFKANEQPLEMIFDNVSGIGSVMENTRNGVKDGVMTLGEGKGLGKFDGPTQLSFFINADGNRGGTNLFGSDGFTGDIVDGRTVNADGFSHLVAYNYFDQKSQENYTIIGFEDLWGEKGHRKAEDNNGYDLTGADRDFNDVVFAVKGLSQGAPPTPTDVPEPSLLLGMLGVFALGAKGAKRKLTT